MTRKPIFILLFLSFTNLANAIDFEDAVFPELATSTRAKGMGNAFISKVDDATAAFYNPAGLGSVRNTSFHLSNISLEMNKGYITTGSRGPGLDAVANSTKLFSIDGTRELLKNNPNTITHSRFHMLPNLTTRYFSAGYLVSKYTRAVVTDTADVEGFEFADRLDHGPYAAINFSFFGGILKLGGSAIYLKRKELKDEVDPNQTIQLESKDYNKGSAIVTTLGTKLTLPIAFLPTFSATFHNALGANFKQIGGVGKPEDIKSTIDIGFSITPQIATRSRIHLELNYKDLSKEFEKVDAKRKLLLGLELDFYRAIFIRAGYGDGFGSFGLGARTKRFEFDIATYAVDTTTAKFRGKEDRRFALGFSSGF